MNATLTRLIQAANDGQPLLPRAEVLGLELVTISIQSPDFYGALIERADGQLAFGTPTREHDGHTEAALRECITYLATHPKPVKHEEATADDVLGTHERAPWCTDDHVLDEREGAFKADVWHHRYYDGSDTVPMFWPGKDNGTEETSLLSPVMDVMPFSDAEARRQPVVSVAVVEDHVVEDMGPSELEAFIATVRAQCDRLDTVLADLIQARAQWNEGQA
ncbi:DUF6907 domain-containing protein [Streptomyces sp. NRRL F-5630]|uniref:DUF6907 domain-containing protein n=1 Tax=Streptomyces sp. NRRL F-5630 TaxID=1463864 RepID=UPI003D727721